MADSFALAWLSLQLPEKHRRYSSDMLIADLTHALEFHGRPLLGRQMRLEVSQQWGQRHTYTPQSSG
uniref:Uncharacterized protein n=1 Tax=Brassica oleracea TaxID=3712 RepID=A0A3P6GD68_BRAOL|nr:unnamed protein product [Brassica oleracea]